MEQHTGISMCLENFNSSLVAFELITPPPAFLAFVEGKWDPINNK